jgi:hypothetical protein
MKALIHKGVKINSLIIKNGKKYRNYKIKYKACQIDMDLDNINTNKHLTNMLFTLSLN